MGIKEELEPSRPSVIRNDPMEVFYRGKFYKLNRYIEANQEDETEMYDDYAE